MSDPPPLLRVSDLAKLMQVSVRTIWRLRSMGVLPAPIRVGGSVRWERNRVEQWMKNGCQAEKQKEI